MVITYLPIARKSGDGSQPLANREQIPDALRDRHENDRHRRSSLD
jgi:hypothetical protein